MFECRVEQAGGIWLVRPIGKMTGKEVPAFQETLRTALPESGGKVVVDLSKAEYIGSQGFSLFVFLAEQHQVKLAGATRFIRDTFRVLRLDSILLFYDTVDLALLSFAGTATPPPLPPAGKR